MPSQPETKLVRKIRTVLQAQIGGLWIKQHGSQYSQQGVPDLIGCVNGYFIGLEVKTPDKKHTLTKLQRLTLGLIETEGGGATVVTSPEEAVDFVWNYLNPPNVY